MAELPVASAEGGLISVWVDVVSGTARKVGVRARAGLFGGLAAEVGLIDGTTRRFPEEGVERVDGAPFTFEAPIPSALRFAVDPWPEAVWVRLKWSPDPPA